MFFNYAIFKYKQAIEIRKDSKATCLSLPFFINSSEETNPMATHKASFSSVAKEYLNIRNKAQICHPQQKTVLLKLQRFHRDLLLLRNQSKVVFKISWVLWNIAHLCIFSNRDRTFSFWHCFVLFLTFIWDKKSWLLYSTLSISE